MQPIAWVCHWPGHASAQGLSIHISIVWHRRVVFSLDLEVCQETMIARQTWLMHSQSSENLPGVDIGLNALSWLYCWYHPSQSVMTYAAEPLVAMQLRGKATP